MQCNCFLECIFARDRLQYRTIIFNFIFYVIFHDILNNLPITQQLWSCFVFSYVVQKLFNIHCITILQLFLIRTCNCWTSSSYVARAKLSVCSQIAPSSFCCCALKKHFKAFVKWQYSWIITQVVCMLSNCRLHANIF